MALDVAQLGEAKQSQSTEPHPKDSLNWWHGPVTSVVGRWKLGIQKDLKVTLGSTEGSTRASLGYMRSCPRMTLNFSDFPCLYLACVPDEITYIHETLGLRITGD